MRQVADLVQLVVPTRSVPAGSASPASPDTEARVVVSFVGEGLPGTGGSV